MKSFGNLPWPSVCRVLCVVVFFFFLAQITLILNICTKCRNFKESRQFIVFAHSIDELPKCIKSKQCFLFFFFLCAHNSTIGNDAKPPLHHPGCQGPIWKPRHRKHRWPTYPLPKKILGCHIDLAAFGHYCATEPLHRCSYAWLLRHYLFIALCGWEGAEERGEERRAFLRLSASPSKSLITGWRRSSELISCQHLVTWWLI